MGLRQKLIQISFDKKRENLETARFYIGYEHPHFAKKYLKRSKRWELFNSFLKSGPKAVKEEFVKLVQKEKTKKQNE